MRDPAYTPYDGSGRLFQIGLSLLDPDCWIEPDDDLAAQLSEKRRLLALHREQVFQAEPGTEDAQQECLDLLVDHLAGQHSRTHHINQNTIEMAGHRLDLKDTGLPPLLRAGLIVQDDLVILRRKADGWHLAAASLSFPSSWSLGDKIGRPMEDVHGPVPGFGGDTPNASRINRIFDNLPVSAPVKRMNWSINRTGELYLPGPHESKGTAFPARESHVRVERQTLRKLARTGDIVFTIRIYVDALTGIMTTPRAADFASAFAGQILDLTPEQARYKGLSQNQQELAEFIRSLGPA